MHRADVKAAEAELRALVPSGEDPFVDQDFPIPRNGQGEGLQGAVMDVKSARLDLLRALVFIRSLEARTETLAHSLGLMRGPKWTGGEIRWTAAAMSVLGMDQECWDLLQWWSMANGQPDVDRLSIISPSLPILKFPRGVSVMEPIAGDSHWIIFDRVTPYFLLLKVQALLDLTRLSLCAPAFAAKVSREIFDSIRGYIQVSPGVINHPDLRGKLTYTNEIKQLTRQIESLWDEVGVGSMGEISDVLYKDEDWHMHRWNDGGQPLSPCLNCVFRRDPEAVAYIRSFIYRDVVKKPW